MSKKTSKKHGKKHDKRLDNLKPFTSENQPSPEAKKAWRKRRKEAQRMMDTLMSFQEMNAEQIKAYIEKHRDEIPVKDLVMLQYLEDILKNPKIRIDWINRHVPYAPQKQEITWDGWKALFDQIEVTVVWGEKKKKAVKKKSKKKSK